MLVFIDESYQQRQTGEMWTALSALCLPRESSREVARELYNLKKRFWRKRDPCDIELKGASLLNRRAILLPKNRDFVQQIISLCKLYLMTPFAVAQQSPEGMELSRLKATGNIPDLHRAILRRVHMFISTKHPDRRGTLFFDERERETNRRISRSFEAFLFRTREGQEMQEIVETPFFYDSEITPTGQIADIVAYVMCARYAGRRNEQDLERVFIDLRHMTYNHAPTSPEGKSLWGFSALGIGTDQSDNEGYDKEKGTGGPHGP